MEKEIGAFDFLINHYCDHHSWYHVFLMFWNFLGSLTIMVLSYWRLQDIISQKPSFNSRLDFVGVKASLILITIGAFYHAIVIQVPSFREGCMYSGVLLYLLLRRRKQLRDNKADKLGKPHDADIVL